MGTNIDPQIEPRRFREVLGHLPTGVTVVTAHHPSGPVAMSANSVTSVSLEPPLILFCPAKTSSTWLKIHESGRFCVNVFAAHQGEISERFAARGVDRFAGVAWHSRSIGSSSARGRPTRWSSSAGATAPSPPTTEPRASGSGGPPSAGSMLRGHVSSVDAVTRRRVSFSRNLTLSLSRTCVSHCKYCAFATHQPHLHEPDEVRRLLDHAARRNVKELLILTGDDPAHHPGVRERLEALGFGDFVDYVVWCCREALERGLLPHTNLGALAREDLARLREVTASQGVMLESLRGDLVAHQGSPTKDPALRLETIRAAGELRIPFTSGILVGIGERAEDRFAALDELARLDRPLHHRKGAGNAKRIEAV